MKVTLEKVLARHTFHELNREALYNDLDFRDMAIRSLRAYLKANEPDYVFIPVKFEEYYRYTWLNWLRNSIREIPVMVG